MWQEIITLGHAMVNDELRRGILRLLGNNRPQEGSSHEFSLKLVQETANDEIEVIMR